MASGEVIGLINSDDQLYPGAIKHIVDNYENWIDVYYGDAVIIDRKYGREFYRKAFDLKEMEYCLPFFHQSCFIAKRAYEKYGLYDKKYKHCMDYDLIRKMYSQSARFFYIGEILSKFSWGGVSSTEWMQTTLEDVKIAIRYGLPRYKGLFFFVKTILRAALKRTLEATGLFACVAKIRDRKRSIPKE